MAKIQQIMKKYTFKTNYKKLLCDTHTPVELYLKLRDRFPNSFLLESSDYKSKENSYSYLCLNPIASFSVEHENITMEFPDASTKVLKTEECDVSELLFDFSKIFEMKDLQLGFESNGLFGYTSYDAIPLFEEIEFTQRDFDLPLMQYQLFKYLIVINHFNNEMFVMEFLLEEEESSIQMLTDIITIRSVNQFQFDTIDEEVSNFTDDEFLNKIEIGKKHCYLGDVFQVVLSRKYEQGFKGDEFNVYRALRSINPSPYLFYFDYGNFKIFGSSPEAQLTIEGGLAAINPIAGTFKRTGDAKQDTIVAEQLLNDPKESAEHVMLVDLARNDLSKSSKQVEVNRFKQIEYYSHVIHLVSKVTAQLPKGSNPIKILGETYPAGTLSGAPKHRAMQIIDTHEPESRGFYGGAVGIIGLNGSFNHTIFIRSFVSRNQKLRYQAGCGIVAMSDAQSELQEVHNKLSALRNAMDLAKTINQ